MAEPIDPNKHSVTPEEVAKLWMSENAVVNQKTAYFIAASAFIVSAIAQASVQLAGMVFLAICGFIISGVTFLSIARTCTYREHLRKVLKERSHDYDKVLTPTFGYFDGFRSIGVLKALPLLAMIAWGAFLVSVLTKVFVR